MRKIQLAHLASKGAPMTGRAENEEQEETPRAAARKSGREPRSSQARLQAHPEEHNISSGESETSKARTDMTPIDPDLEPTLTGARLVDPDDAPTMVDSRYRHHHHLLARAWSTQMTPPRWL